MKLGVPPAQPYPARERYKFGNGRLGEVRNVAEIPVGITGGRGAFTTSPINAERPAILRQEAPGALGGHLRSPRTALTSSVAREREGPLRSQRGPHVAKTADFWGTARRNLFSGWSGIHRRNVQIYQMAVKTLLMRRMVLIKLTPPRLPRSVRQLR